MKALIIIFVVLSIAMVFEIFRHTQKGIYNNFNTVIGELKSDISSKTKDVVFFGKIIILIIPLCVLVAGLFTSYWKLSLYIIGICFVFLLGMFIGYLYEKNKEKEPAVR